MFHQFKTIKAILISFAFDDPVGRFNFNSKKSSRNQIKFVIECCKKLFFESNDIFSYCRYTFEQDGTPSCCDPSAKKTHSASSLLQSLISGTHSFLDSEFHCLLSVSSTLSLSSGCEAQVSRAFVQAQLIRALLGQYLFNRCNALTL